MAETESGGDWASAPYAQWLEESIRDMVEFKPISIAMQMMDSTGLVETRYYNTTPNGRACMVDAMRDDTLWEWLVANREEIRAILGDEGEDEDDDDDELQDTDPETDSEE